MTPNITLNTISELQELPTSEDIARKKIIIQYIDRLASILCGGDAESVYREWFHPCAGLKCSPVKIPDVTPESTVNNIVSVSNNSYSLPRSSAYYFSLYIIPVTVHYFGSKIARKLENIHNAIKTNFTYSSASEHYIWKDVDTLIHAQNALFDIIKQMNIQLYAPSIKFTHFQPTIMTFEEKSRILITISYVIVVLKLALF